MNHARLIGTMPNDVGVEGLCSCYDKTNRAEGFRASQPNFRDQSEEINGVESSHDFGLL